MNRCARWAMVAVAFVTAIPNISNANPFRVIGTRAVGLGGAFVAVSDSSSAQYWNPAALASGDTFDLEIAAGANAEFTKDILKRADDISELATQIDTIQNKTGSSAFQLSDYENFSKILNNVNSLNDEGMGALVGVEAASSLRYKRFAISYNNYWDIGVDPFVDLQNVGLVDATGALDAVSAAGNTTAPAASVASSETVSELASVISEASTKLGIELPTGFTPTLAANAIINEASVNGATSTEIATAVDTAKTNWDTVSSALPASVPVAGSSFDNNQTDITLRGAQIRELAIGAGFNIPAKNEWLSSVAVGANLKLMSGEVGYTKILVINEEVQMDEVINDLVNNSKSTTQLSIDMGLMLDRKKANRFKLGLVGKNLNSPSFKAPEGGEDQSYKAQFRIGGAYWLFDRWLFAMDYDLNKNDTALPGFRSQNFAVGTELKVVNSKRFDIALRGGWTKNMAESTSNGTYTAGLGLTILHVNLDLAGGLTPDSVEIEDGTKIPQRVFASVMLSTTW